MFATNGTVDEAARACAVMWAMTRLPNNPIAGERPFPINVRNIDRDTIKSNRDAIKCTYHFNCNNNC